jgi:hypothetical protein
MRKFLLWAAVVLSVAAVGAGAWWLTRPHPVDPRTAALPTPSASAATVQAYFRGSGAPLVDFVRTTTDLPADADKSSCTALADRLAPLGSPKALASKATAVPDATVAAAALNHVSAVSRYVAACGSGTGLADAAADAHFTAVVLTRLLTQEHVL